MAGLVDKLKDRANNIVDGLKQQYGKAVHGLDWPQVNYSPLDLYPNYKTKGWLPPTSILVDQNEMSGKYPRYKYTDWRGHMIDNISVYSIDNLISKFDKTRNIYARFNDFSTDYFKHGIQAIDDLGGVSSAYNANDGSNMRIDNFVETPYENTDPIMYGFDIVIDNLSSPLLNGSIIDFIANYSNITEIKELKPVYEDFKQQFIKFFKTKTTVSIGDSATQFTNLRKASEAELGRDSDLFTKDRTAYMNYYLKKISGLDQLIERNTPNSKKFLNKYNEDVISLTFNEDVSMSIGALAHLYKLLYWSKSNGKGLIPENLLRFNCDIIISEVRNFNRVKRIIGGDESAGNYIQEIKDNVSRYIYSLKECQFYFNTLPHPSEVDLTNLSEFKDGYVFQFDYKYVTHKMERFTPIGYIGYDSGSMWKVSNSRNGSGSVELPKFFTVGENRFNENGIDNDLIINDSRDYREKIIQEFDESDDLDKAKIGETNKGKELFNRITDRALNTATGILQTKVNSMTGLLNKSLNKITNSLGITGVSAPRNVYDKPLSGGQRIFYDVRNELINFLGDSLSDALNGNFTKKTF